MDKKFLQTVRELSILVAIGTTAIMVLNYTTDIFSSPKVIEKEIQKEIIKEVPAPVKPFEYPDYDYYMELKKVSLASSTESWVKKSDDTLDVEGRTFQKFIKIDGQITNGYLFVNVSVDNGKPLTIWDSVYVSLRKEVNGYLYWPIEGHLLRSKSLPTPKDGKTVLLYDLRQIPFTKLPYSENNNCEVKSWLSIIQSANKFQFETFLSTLRRGGEINDISIGYECSAETPNCQLEIIDN